jgi:hypothetical protein
MTKEEKKRKGEEETNFLPVFDGEMVEILPDSEEITIVSAKNKIAKPKKTIQNPKSKIQNQKTYLLLPFIFLTVVLLGGLRIGTERSEFIFWRPSLFCLMAAAVLIVLFFRANLIKPEGWFSEDFTTTKNIANGAVLLTLFAASVQIFNALIPEQGLPFWIVAFCFFWTLWNNLFADFDTRKLIRSLGALFGLAFVVKYLILINLTAPSAESWWQGIWQHPTKEAFTWLLDLPRFSGATGYIQFFTVIFYLLGLFLLRPSMSEQAA